MIKIMYLRNCGSFKSTKIIGSANRKSANCPICGRCANLLPLFPSTVILLPNKSISGESLHVAGTPLPGRGLHDEVGCRCVEPQGRKGHDIIIRLISFTTSLFRSSKNSQSLNSIIVLKTGRWVAQLVARLLASYTAALWVRIQASLKKTKTGDISKGVWPTHSCMADPPYRRRWDRSRCRASTHWTCLLDSPSWLMRRHWPVHFLSAAFPLPVRCLSATYPQPVRCLSASCPQPVHLPVRCLSTDYPLPVSYLSAACPLPVRCLSTACPLPVRCLSAACPLSVRCLSTACPLPVRCLSAACPLPVHCLSTACPLPVHCLSTACPLPVSLVNSLPVCC